MKSTISTEQIGSFGGLNFISKHFTDLGLEKLINEHLGSRPLQSRYSYADVIKNLWLVFFAGGDCAEDIEEHLKRDLEQTLDVNSCSADTLARVQKGLSGEKEIFVSNSNTVHEFSKHSKLNELNLDLLLKTKSLIPSEYYDFDYDNQFIPCEKYDSKKSYKMKHGYFPGVSTIGRHIVHFENRNGNSNVKYKQAETLKSAYDLLKSRNIKIDRSRMDCGSFSSDILSVIESNSKRFYVRAQRCGELSEQVRQVEKWERVQIGNIDVEVCSILYAPFGKEKKYRYVIQRETNKTGQADIEFQDHFIYRAIITNDIKTIDREIIDYYNQRGAAERIFDEMNNDFGWKNLPFSFLEENTVFMIIMAMCRNFYLHIVNQMAEKVPFIQPTFRMKKFIFRFVVVPFKWIKKARQKILKLYTDKPYPQLI